MKVHIVTIGDEILIGQTLNTNAAFIGSLLSENNITIAKTSVVGDVEEDIIQELDTCLGKNDIVISTGGLGPTNDDITRNSIVKYFNTELVLNEDVLRNIEERFKKINREVTPVNRDQAIVPANAKIITNNFGTAPGYWIEKNKKILIVLPGVPHEMKAMMNSYVLPSLKELLTYTDGITKKINLLTTGIGESTLYEKLGNIDELLSGAKIAFLPSPSGTKMRITAAGNDEESVNNKLIEVEQKIRALAGRYIFGKGEEELAGVVGRLLKERGLTVAVAESCTGGIICSLITDFAGSSQYFERGIVCYSNAAKVELLKVDEDLIAKFGAVSLEVARQLAEGIRAISGTDIGLAITGIMGPGGGSVDKPVGTVYIGLCDRNVCTAQRFNFADDRLLNKQRASYAALELLRKYILGIENNV